MEYQDHVDQELEEFSKKSVEDMDIDVEDSNYRTLNNLNICLESDFPMNLSKKRNSDLSNYRTIYFRNYIPTDQNFLIDKLPYFEKISEVEKNYEKKVKKGIKEFLNLEKNPIDLVPKKINIDLKKNIAKKLEKLNKKTELAILELIKENIEKQKKEFEYDNQKLEPKSEKRETSGDKLLKATNMRMQINTREIEEDLSEEENDSEDSSYYDKKISELN
jgi:coiled-coil domain-containing protein 12